MENDDPIIILHFLATGITRWHKSFIDTGKVYPYPDELQVGLNKLASYSLEKNYVYPQIIPEAIQWFARPLSLWPQLKDEMIPFDIEDSLLANGIPTELCYELALGSDVEQELTEGLLLKALSLCQAKGSAKDYVRFRRFIIENPVLDREKVMRFSNDPRNGVAAFLLPEAYEDLPASALGPEGKYYRCSNCNWVLEWWKEKEARCIHERCISKTNNFEKRKALEGSNLVRLKRGIMRFITWPGQWELKLEKELKRLDKELKVELWPNFDVYDLRITFPDGKVWAVDVKDWKNPYLLAMKAGTIPSYPEWDKAFWIIPNYQWIRYVNYGQEFSRFHPLNDNEFIDSLGNFIKRVKRQLEVE